jgi:glycosyltransferase involved in cell wall biosynthesis
MSTADRRFLVPQAICYFLNQDCPNRELIIVDDGEASIADLVPSNTSIRYIRLPHRHTIGTKRNIACEQSVGDIIADWDNDDWIANWRLSCQVDALLKASGSKVCGFSNIFYYRARQQHAWPYIYPERQRRWLAGNTLCYQKELWRSHPFPNIDEGENTRFIRSIPESCLLARSDSFFYVATVHEKNSSPKRTQDTRWFPHTVDEIERLLGPDLTFYRSFHWTRNACKELLPV